MGRHSTVIETTAEEVPSITSSSPARKRKRDDTITAEIEVDITAPEPPSKKALRKAKKKESNAPTSAVAAPVIVSQPASGSDQAPPTTAPKRSEYGIWIGNLPWTATKATIREFITNNTEITDGVITRLHMPTPSDWAATRQRIKPQNKGFAYIDFTTQAALDKALTLSEKLITGRRVLIKDSKSFEGRPEKSKEEESALVNSGKPPSKRIFVGNLGFDATKDTLQEHFARCGEIADVHVATFEDSGKCKGYAWVTFEELEAAEAAIRGWIDFEQRADNEDKDVDEDEENVEALIDDAKVKKKPRPRKWWVNKLHGRPLRMEFAEDSAIRYKKRYGKDGSARKDRPDAEVSISTPVAEVVTENTTNGPRPSNPDRKPVRRVDARNIKPGAALAAAPRLTGSIVESKGKKITFA